MTRLDQRIQKCAVCGAEKKVIDIMSTSSFGPMDLDTRPPMMARSTLKHQIQYCENCHYSNNNISSKIRGFDKVMLASKEYLDIVNKDINKTAKAFILSGQLKSNVYDYKDAGFQCLKAAWFFDETEPHTRLFIRE